MTSHCISGALAFQLCCELFSFHIRDIIITAFEGPTAGSQAWVADHTDTLHFFRMQMHTRFSGSSMQPT